MLQWLRENLKSLAWTLWIVIAAFILLYIPDFISGQPSANAAATVGESEISFNEFQRAYRNEEDRLRQRLGDQLSPDLMRQLQIPRQVINSLVADKVQLAEARKMGLQVTDAELQKALLQLPYFKDENGNFIGDEPYARLLRSSGYATPGEFEEEQRNNLLLAKFQAIIASNLYVSDEEVERADREQTERAKIRYLQVPRARFAEQIEISDAELAEYYESQSEQFRLPEQRVATYLLLDRNLLRRQIEVTDEELQAYYDENPDRFTQEETVRARHILLYVNDDRSDDEARSSLEAVKRRVASGEDFATIAQEISDDSASKERGGDLGFFSRGQMVPEFEQAAFGSEVGELVGPVKTSFGYHLIEVLGKREGGKRPIEDVKSQIRVWVINEKLEPAAETAAQQLAAKVEEVQAETDEQFLAIADADEAVTMATTAPFDSQGIVAGLGRVPEFAAEAFEAEVGEVSELIQVPRGWAVMRLDEVRDPTVPPLEEIQIKVRQAMISEREQEVLMERLQELRGEIDNGSKSLDQIAEELDIDLQETEEFRRGIAIPGIGLNAELSEAALEMDEGAVGGPFADNVGGLLFEVTERQRWDRESFEADKEASRLALEQRKVNQVLAAMIEERKRSLDIRYTNQFLETYDILEGQASL